MSYLELLPAMLSGHPQIFQMAVDGSVRKHTIINIIITGVLFGASNIIGVFLTDPALCR